MIKNYLRIALRNFIRNKQITLINLIGLSIGMACSILIFIWTNQELSYDNFHEKKDRIFRIVQDGWINGDDVKVALTAPGLGKKMNEIYPEIETTTRIRLSRQNAIVKYKNQRFFESNLYYADSNIFDVFTIPFINGNAKTALKDPNTVVINESLATKYFKDENPVGKSIFIDDNSFLVNGVFEDLPANSHLNYKIIISLSTSQAHYYSKRITGGQIYTYILLKDKGYLDAFKTKTSDFIEDYLKPTMQDQGIDVDAIFEGDANNYFQYQLQPITKIYLNSHMRFEIKEGGNLKIVYMFISIGIIILVVACINFINLTTSRLLIRNKEIALRKIVGAQKKSIIFQILTETLLISVIALQFAIILVEILRPGFNQLINSNITINYFDPNFIKLCFYIILFSGFLAGLYPGFLYSSLNPIRLLKFRYTLARDKRSFRRPLIFLQYAIAFSIIVFALIVNRQLDFIIHKDLGFQSKNIIITQTPNYEPSKIQEFFKQIKNESDILDAGTLQSEFGESYSDYHFKKVGDENLVSMQIQWADHTYASIFDMQLLSGRFFDNTGNDSLNIIINERAVKELQLKNPIGSAIHTYSDPNTLYKIIGVVKNHHFESLQTNIRPLAISYYNNCARMAIKINGENTNKSLTTVENVWKEHFPDTPLNYTFVDDRLHNLYRNYFISKKVLLIFSIISILIACIGLFGFSAFTTERKTKEIGIRKVNGGTSSDIIRLLLFDQIKISFIAILFSIPISIYLITKWLENFAYSVTNYWIIFFEAGTILLLIAISTIAFQTYIASIKNPVDCLRYE
jgi:putative ABC transport system permease protein